MSDLKALFVLLAIFFYLGFFCGSKGFRVLFFYSVSLMGGCHQVSLVGRAYNRVSLMGRAYNRVSLMGRIVTECGENIDRAQLDTTLDDVHSAGMDWNLQENMLCLSSEYCLKILK